MESFVEELFDENPISQLGIIVTSNKRAEKVTELGGKTHTCKVTELGGMTHTCKVTELGGKTHTCKVTELGG